MAGELSEIFARVAGLLLTETVVDHAVESLAQVAHESVAGSVGAGGTLIDAQGRPTSTASTNALVEEMDRLQYDLGEGPCLSAWAGARPSALTIFARNGAGRSGALPVLRWACCPASASRCGCRTPPARAGRSPLER